jgi:predicted NUDIX family NTP pyrophosphohydrolase
MAARVSAGLLLFRRATKEVFLVHPGGPLWAKKDIGAWSIPKGQADGDEPLLETAIRELAEETGCAASGPFIALEPIRQRSGKMVHAWAAEGHCDAAAISSNLFEMEWPPKSGRMQRFPEVDRAAWFTLDEARERILPGQLGFLDQLTAYLESQPSLER